MYNNNFQLLSSFKNIVRPLFRNFIYLYIYILYNVVTCN